MEKFIIFIAPELMVVIAVAFLFLYSFRYKDPSD